MQNHWKTETTDLRTRATDVVSGIGAGARMSARTAARCLSGVVSHIVRRSSQETMQRACAELVRCELTWASSFRVMPRDLEGPVHQAVELLAVVATGIMPLCGPEAMRSALAFWASEEDPAVWQRITDAAA